jgi:hypothetical protein
MTDTDNTRELARQLLHVTQASQKATALLTKLFDRFDPERLGFTFDDLSAYIDRVGVDLYAEYYTPTEMRDALAFYASDSGQAIQTKMPLLEQRIADAMQSYFSERLGKR